MNPIRTLERDILTRIPHAVTALDPARTATGGWFLDITLHGRAFVVEWRPLQGFGISTQLDPAYGEGPDEIYPDSVAATQRVLELLAATRPAAAPSVGPS